MSRRVSDILLILFILAALWNQLLPVSNGPGREGSPVIEIGFSTTATYVIAAKDTSGINKAKADYVCDGRWDDVQIQAAHDALPPDGGSIFLLEGTYKVSSTVTFRKEIRLFGTGFASHVESSVNAAAFKFSSADGSSVSNIRLTGPAKKKSIGILMDTSDDVFISESWIDSFGEASVKVRSGLNTVITNNVLASPNSYSTAGKERHIYLTGTIHEIIISDNHFENGSVGIYCDLWNGDVDFAAIESIVDLNIRDNTFDNCQDHAIHLIGALVTSITDNQIENCEKIDEYAILIDYQNIAELNGSPFPDTAVIIASNYLNALYGHGIHLINGVGHIISDNVFQSVDGNPIKIERVTEGNYDVGHTVTVANNTVILGQTTGVGRSETIDIAVDGLTFTANNIEGMNLEALRYVGNDGVIANNRISDCNQIGTQTEIISLAGSGNLINGNLIRGGAVNSSIREQSGSDYNSFTSNVTTDGIVITGDHTVKFANQLAPYSHIQ